jgi:hypothetical protein
MYNRFRRKKQPVFWSGREFEARGPARASAPGSLSNLECRITDLAFIRAADERGEEMGPAA